MMLLVIPPLPCALALAVPRIQGSSSSEALPRFSRLARSTLARFDYERLPPSVLQFLWKSELGQLI